MTIQAKLLCAVAVSGFAAFAATAPAQALTRRNAVRNIRPPRPPARSTARSGTISAKPNAVRTRRRRRRPPRLRPRLRNRRPPKPSQRRKAAAPPPHLPHRSRSATRYSRPPWIRNIAQEKPPQGPHAHLLDQCKANKAANTNGGMNWNPKGGGGYYQRVQQEAEGLSVLRFMAGPGDLPGPVGRSKLSEQEPEDVAGREPSISRGGHGKNLLEYNGLDRADRYFPKRPWRGWTVAWPEAVNGDLDRASVSLLAQAAAPATPATTPPVDSKGPQRPTASGNCCAFFAAQPSGGNGSRQSSTQRSGMRPEIHGRRSCRQAEGPQVERVSPGGVWSKHTQAVFPSAVAPKYSGASPDKARTLTCADQFSANKATNANGGLKWIEMGGGYYSECVSRLKG